MNRYINCIAHGSSEGNLLIGDSHTALFDCGMAFCADQTIHNVASALDGRPLDYIFASHTHYDHIGGLPFFRDRWPDARLVSCQAGAEVLLKATPRRVIRELSAAAARDQRTVMELSYDDDVFRADMVVKGGDNLWLGGLTVQVLETPGHTRDSLSFYVQELKLLIACETPGVLLTDGTMVPFYLTGFGDTINAIEACRNTGFEALSSPHRGLLSSAQAEGYFDKAYAANQACCDFILEMKAQGLQAEAMLECYFERYGIEPLLAIQPKEAFMANARATVACTLREFG